MEQLIHNLWYLFLYILIMIFGYYIITDIVEFHKKGSKHKDPEWEPDDSDDE